MEYVGIQTQVRRNNLRSTLLLVLFPTVLVGLTWLFFLIIFNINDTTGYDSATVMSTVNHSFLQALPWVVGICGLWFVIAYFAHSSMINAATHSHSLSRKDNKRVYNLTENLCMANGMQMPKLNVIEDSSINAFASGINQKTYTVTLSRGAIDKLTDEELEGVIAHELTHIRNRDVRLLIVSIIFVGIFAFISNLMVRSLIFGNLARRGNRNDKGGGAIIIIVVILLAAIGYMLTMFVRFAISRKREYMADAGGAQMTKNPRALASALRKISGDSRIEAVTRDDVAQLFIEHAAKGKDGKSNFFSGLFATHPPIEKRIAILEQF